MVRRNTYHAYCTIPHQRLHLFFNRILEQYLRVHWVLSYSCDDASGSNSSWISPIFNFQLRDHCCCLCAYVQHSNDTNCWLSCKPQRHILANTSKILGMDDVFLTNALLLHRDDGCPVPCWGLSINREDHGRLRFRQESFLGLLRHANFACYSVTLLGCGQLSSARSRIQYQLRRYSKLRFCAEITGA